jgi:sec-independent protein translocase protein TatA
MLGAGEIILIGSALVLIFGATQIPKIARSLGEGLKELKKAARESEEPEPDKEESPDKKE